MVFWVRAGVLEALGQGQNLPELGGWAYREAQ